MNNKSLNLLEFNIIKKELLNYIISNEGSKLVEKMSPSDDINRINLQLKEVSEARTIVEKTTAIPIQNLNNTKQVMDKLDKEINLIPEDLTIVANMLRNIRRLKRFMLENESLAPTISSYASSLYELDNVIKEIDFIIINNQVIDTASPKLEKIRKKINIAKDRIQSKLNSILKSSTYKKYLQEDYVSIKNNHYVLAVKSEYKGYVNGTVVDKSTTGSTFFIEPSSVGKYQNEIDMLAIDEENEIYQILSYMTALIKGYHNELTLNLEVLANYDFIFAKGKYSKSINGKAVSTNYNGHTNIINGRHPLLGNECVPLNFEIGNDYTALVITGPNTGGKTVALKTVGLFTAMVQSGLHVPVDVDSAFAIYSDVLVDIGDGQSILQSLSTFSSHIKNIIQIIEKANRDTLVILDEVGAGTDPTEGEGLAIAILKEIYARKATIIATSHYSKVKEFAYESDGFSNGKMAFDIKTLKPKYKLAIGEAGESNAFIIALKLGLNQKVIEDAHELTYKEKKDYTKLFSSYNPNNPKLPIVKHKAKNRSKPILNMYTSNDINSKAINNEDTAILRSFKIGDSVNIPSLNQRGLICELENKMGEYLVQVKDKKMLINKKRMTLFLDAKKLYPEDYDFDIVFKSKAHRKKNRIMSKRYDENVSIEYNDEE